MQWKIIHKKYSKLIKIFGVGNIKTWVWLSTMWGGIEIKYTSVQTALFEASKLPVKLLGFLRLSDSSFEMLCTPQIKLSSDTVQHLQGKLYNRYDTETLWVLVLKNHNRWDVRTRNIFPKECCPYFIKSS